VLIDGHALVFRAFYAFPPTLTDKEGNQVNAIYGFSSILLSVIRELKPTYLAVAFDLDKPTFRHKEYVGYKAQRPEVDEELVKQIDGVKDVVKALNIPIFEVEGFEADDVIGTLSVQAVRLARQTQSKLEIVIVTGDQDAMQLVNKQVKVYVPGRGTKPAKMYGEKEVRDRYELEPKQIIDLKALMGDPSDNIPGVKGVGPKTATDLLKKFMTVERVYSVLYSQDKDSKEFKGFEGIRPQDIDSSLLGISKSVLQKLVNGYEEAVRGKKLATIVLDVPISLDLKACEVNDYERNKVVKMFEDYGFNSLIKRLPSDDWQIEEIEEVFEEKKDEKKGEQVSLF